MAELKTSTAGIDLIKQFESLQLEAYLCPAHVWTIGWGHTSGVQPGQRITQAEADALLETDIAAVERTLPKTVHAPLTQGQWDALVSLCFNLKGGAQGLARIAPKLVAKLNSGDSSGAANELLDINRANGQVLPGLTRRREAERTLFLS